ncbi:MAG TPA: GntR family transcriptional regulator [Anaerolineales bacterium]|jgi:DNA-binding GntR family transcriptional regulator|nr:GntR family transcriptional regulator [Anaerolineales bacterium]
MAFTDADKAYQEIKQKIVTIEMRPGAVIREADLMQDLRLGRTPIREALKRLQSENLVIASPRRGMFVADIAITDLTQIYEMRVELESLCARLAAQRINVEQVKKMQCLVEEFRKTDQEDNERLLALDGHFHVLLAEAANNKFLRDELEHLHNLSMRIWHLALTFTRPEDIDVGAHLDILAAIEARDHLLAEKRMRKHIEKFHQTIRQYL